MATSTCHLPPLSPLLPGPASPCRLHLQLSPPPFNRHLRPPIRLLRAARRRHPDAVVVVPDAHPWVGDLSGAASYPDGSEEDGDEEGSEDDRSLDLLARFLHSIFRKVSRRARRAARSVLPPSVPAELVKFSVNGVLVLTFLWILKGLLEILIMKMIATYDLTLFYPRPGSSSSKYRLTTTFIQAPKMRAGNNEDFLPRNGRWNLAHKKLCKTSTISRWSVVNFSARCDVQGLVRDLKRLAIGKGLECEDPHCIIEENPSMRRAPVSVRLDEMFDQIKRSYLEHQCFFCAFFLRGKTAKFMVLGRRSVLRILALLHSV